MGVAEPSRLPLYYFGVAHVALAGAGLTLLLEPELLAGFFYQSPMMAGVHLVTLGWISGSILGALYLVAPMALRTQLRETRTDVVIWFLYSLGVSGMVSHFWLDTWSGMLWSTLLVVVGILFVGVRTIVALQGATVASGVKLHVGLAFLNLLLAALAGMLLAYNKVAESVLPVQALDGVYAHFHLAALGWATMMVMGVGYRLLPMLLPAEMPRGLAPVASAVLLEVGVLGLAVSFLWRPELRAPSAVLSSLGVLVFLSQVARMLLRRKPPGRGLPRPDLALMQVGHALVYLVVSLVLGLALAFGETGVEVVSAEQRLRLVPVYAVVVLIGFLAQMVLGVSGRLLPIYAWFRAFAAKGGTQPPPGPYSSTRLLAVATVLFLWMAAVPLLALGLYEENAALVTSAGGGILVAAVVAGGHFVTQLRALREGETTPR